MSIWIKVLMAGNTNGLPPHRRGGIGQPDGKAVCAAAVFGRSQVRQALYNLSEFLPGGENYVLVASKRGKESHPGWFFNLMHQPDTTIQVKRQVVPVKASEAGGADYERLWQYVTGKNEFYSRYQKQTGRKIPIVILTPKK